MTVYLSEHICDSARKKLEAAATIVDNFDHPEEIDAIIVRTAPVTAELLEKATKLKVIGKHGVGYNNVDVAAVKAKGIPMVYTPLAFTPRTRSAAAVSFRRSPPQTSLARSCVARRSVKLAWAILPSASPRSCVTASV